MQNSIWKLTALAGLVGIGFLVVLQAQRGMPVPGDDLATSNAGADAGSASGPGHRPEPDDADAALQFDQYEPAEFGSDEDGSESIAHPGTTEVAGHPLARSEGRSANEDRGNGIDPPPFGSADIHVNAGDPSRNGDADEPAPIFAADARPLESDTGGSEVAADAQPPDPTPATGTSNPFAADSQSEESEAVVIRPRARETRSADAGPVTPASAEFFEDSAPGPQLVGPAFGSNSLPATESDAESAHAGAADAGADPEPVPEENESFTADSPFGDTAAPPEFDSRGTSASTGDSPAPFGGPDGGDSPAGSPGHEDAIEAPEPAGVEELPASDAHGPSAMRLVPAGDSELAGSADQGAVTLDDPPTVSANPFPEAEDDGATPVLAAPDASDPAAGTAEVAGSRAPERLPGSGEESQPIAEDDGPRTVPLASDELRGDGTVGADGPRGSQQPQLTIEKKAPAIAVLGQPLVYSIVVRNVGSTPAHQVVVEDRIPRGSRLTGTIPRAELVQKKLVWKLGVLKPGEEQKIAVRIVPVEEGQIGSIATVNFVAEVAARTTITAPKLELNIRGPSEARLGQPVTFTFRLANTGDGPASDVYLRNIIPEELRHTAGNDLEYKVGELKPGESREISLTVAATEAGTAINRAVATAEGGLSVESTADIAISGNRLRLERSGPKRRFVGREGEFTNTIINESDDKLGTIAVVESVPAGLDFVHASQGGRWDASSRTITWTLPKLDPRAKETLTVKLAGRVTGTHSSEVRVRAAGGDEAQVASETQIEGVAALDLKVADNGSPIDVGDAVTLRIIASNRGSDTASNVRIHVAVPPELELVSAQGQHTRAAGGRIEFAPLPELKGRGQEELLIVLKAVSAGTGDARVEITIEADELARPLKREEAVYILPEADDR